MAKNTRIQDPADAALSAIEEALNLGAAVSSDKPSAARERLPDAEDGFGRDNGRDDADHREAGQAQARSQPERPSVLGSRRAPANDDRESVGQLLYALQRRPSTASYWIASISALVWVVAGFAALAYISRLAPQSFLQPA